MMLRMFFIIVFCFYSQFVLADQSLDRCQYLFGNGTYSPPLTYKELDMERFYKSLDDVTFIPIRWRELTARVVTPETKNLDRISQLRNHDGGKWQKVYRIFKDGREYHYFENAETGAVYDPKAK